MVFLAPAIAPKLDTTLHGLTLTHQACSSRSHLLDSQNQREVVEVDNCSDTQSEARRRRILRLHRCRLCQNFDQGDKRQFGQSYLAGEDNLPRTLPIVSRCPCILHVYFSYVTKMRTKVPKGGSFCLV